MLNLAFEMLKFKLKIRGFACGFGFSCDFLSYDDA